MIRHLEYGVQGIELNSISKLVQDATGIAPENRSSLYWGEYDLFRCGNEIEIAVCENFADFDGELLRPDHSVFENLVFYDGTDDDHVFGPALENQPILIPLEQ